MRAIKIKNGTGNADALSIEDGAPDPPFDGNRVLVRIKAFGLNRMDINQREGRYPGPFPSKARPESNSVGVEFSGHVEALGPDCTSDFKVGDKVFSLAYGGAYAEKISVSEKMLMHMPTDLSFEEAAGTPETFYTALQAVYTVGGMKPGSNVMIHAGASGVGLSAIAIAKVCGASKIITTAGSDEKCRICQSTGADIAINYKTQDFAEIVEKEVGVQSIDVIVDMVGRDYWTRNVRLAAADARIVIVAMMSGGNIDDFNLRDIMTRRICLMTTTLRTRSPEYQVDLRNVFVEKVLPHLASRDIKTVVDRVYPWEQVSEAHKRMEANANAGKIVCTID